MKLPRLRFSVRWMMVVVAIVGLLMGVGRWIVEMRNRSAVYRMRSYMFAMITGSREDVPLLRTKDGGHVDINQDENFWLEDEWARQLAEKYWQLADRPWMPVEPDPPRPDRLVHPRAAIDCPRELRSRGPSCHWYEEASYPWWTFLWTWGDQTMDVNGPRWSFP